MSSRKQRGNQQKSQPQVNPIRDSQPVPAARPTADLPSEGPDSPWSDRISSLPGMSYADSGRVALENTIAEIIRSMAVSAAWKSAVPALGVMLTIVGSAYYLGQRVTQMESSIKSLDKNVADLGADLKEIRKEYGGLLKDEISRSTKIQDSLDRIEKTLAQNSAARKTQ
jgi:hypothetical protein